MHTNIPVSSGFNKKAIGFNGSTDYFEANDIAVGDVTTNNFSVTFTLTPLSDTPGIGYYVISKTNDSNRGYGVDIYNNGMLRLQSFVWDAAGLTQGLNSDIGSIQLGVTHCITVNFDRSTVASSIIDGNQQTTTLNISAHSGSLTNNHFLSLGSYEEIIPFKGNISGLLFANHLTTLAEHQAICKAFKVPSNVSYTQTTTRKWSLGNEPGFGERLGTYGPNQWPVAIQASKISTSNPLGTTFPFFGAVTNSIGYPNEIDQWSVSGAVVSANIAESLDGTMIADRVTFHDNADTLSKLTVGGPIAIGAGERWNGSFYAKRVSGTCTGLQYYCDSGISTPLPLTDVNTWVRYSCNTTSTGSNQGIYIDVATTHGSCVFDMADAQYEPNQLTPPCTACTGDVNCTCNVSSYSTNWSVKSSLMPSALSRMEVIAPSVVDPFYGATNRTLFEAGDNSVGLYEGQVPSFVLRNQGGAVEATVRGKV